MDTVANKLSINYDKTCYMVFSSNHNNNPANSLNILLNHTKILQVQSFNYLGVVIDAKLDRKPILRTYALASANSLVFCIN